MVEVIDGRIEIRFSEDVKVTREMAFDIFGNAGLLILEYTDEGGVMMIRRGRILEWSLPSNQPARSAVQKMGSPPRLA